MTLSHPLPSYPPPLTSAKPHPQSAPVSRLRMSHDEQYVFVAGLDGCLAVLEARSADGRMKAVRDESRIPYAVSVETRNVRKAIGCPSTPNSPPTTKQTKNKQRQEEILVTKSDLEEQNTKMQELKSKVEELKLHNEYQLRLRDMDYNEKIKEVTEKFTQELEQDKNKYELLREEKNDMGGFWGELRAHESRDKELSILVALRCDVLRCDVLRCV